MPRLIFKFGGKSGHKMRNLHANGPARGVVKGRDAGNRIKYGLLAASMPPFARAEFKKKKPVRR